MATSEPSDHRDWWRRPLSLALGYDLDQSLVAAKRTRPSYPAIQDWGAEQLRNLSVTQAQRIDAAVAIRAGHLESAHVAVQEASDPDGMLWHAIIHRLDGDLENSRYWYRRASKHEVQAKLVDVVKSEANLSARVAALAQPDWQLNTWIELHRSKLSPEEQAMLERLAIREWEVLFERSLRETVGCGKR